MRSCRLCDLNMHINMYYSCGYCKDFLWGSWRSPARDFCAPVQRMVGIIEIKRSAAKSPKKIPKADRIRIVVKIDGFTRNLSNPDITNKKPFISGMCV